MLSRDAVSHARSETNDAEFDRDRLTQALKRLGERLVLNCRRSERAKAMRAMRTKLCQPHRGRLVGEMEELSGAIAQISRVAVYVEALGKGN